MVPNRGLPENPGLPGHPYYYTLEDCGKSGGYASCVTKDANQEAWGDAEGYVSSEVGYACNDRMMGSQSGPVNYGVDPYFVRGRNSYAGAMAIKDFVPNDQGYFCPGYTNDVTGSGTNDSTMSTWDSRN